MGVSVIGTDADAESGGRRAVSSGQAIGRSRLVGSRKTELAARSRKTALPQSANCDDEVD